MKEIKQTILTDESKSIIGNCMSAAIAGVLDVWIEDVPYFGEGNPSGALFYERLNSWCDEIGIKHVEYGIDGETLALQTKFHLIYGMTDRHQILQHAVIGSYGRMIFDPHPSDLGLKEITGYGFLILEDAGRYRKWIQEE